MEHYREFNCVVCGAKAIDRSFKKNAKYCSVKCANKNRHGKYGKVARTLPACKFNEGVDCTRKSCDKCGWHPDVERMRKEALV